jgi:hypothetical protein
LAAARAARRVVTLPFWSVLVGGDCLVLLGVLAALQEQGDKAGEQEKLHLAGGTGCPRSDRPPRRQRTASAGLPPGEHRR